MSAVPPLQQAFGLCVQSTLAIPGAQTLPPGDERSPVDLVIEEGAAAIGHIERTGGPYLLTAQSLIFTALRVARYHCRLDGTRVTVEPFPDASREEISHLLIATALPAVLWLRGYTVLHAATTVLAGQQRALAFVGDTGSGKSTLLKDLLDLGSHVVGDDALCLRLADEKIEASGLPSCLFLRSPVSPDGERTAFQIPASHQLEHAELGAIVTLSDASPDDPRNANSALTRLSGSDALAALLNHRHRGAIPSLLGHDPRVLQSLARIAASVPVYSIHSHRQHRMRTCVESEQLRNILQHHESNADGGTI